MGRATEAIDVLKHEVIPGHLEFRHRYSHISKDEALAIRKKSRGKSDDQEAPTKN